MTRKQFRSKVGALIRDNDSALRRLAEVAITSGAFDLAAADGDSYSLPKAFMKAALKSQANAWYPLTKEGKAIAANLRYFI